MTAKGSKTEAEKVQIVKDKMKGMEDDLSLMLRDGHEITTVKGRKLQIPAITGTAEKEAIKIIVRYLREHSGIIKKLAGEGNGLGIEDILSFVIDAADDGYEVIQGLAGSIIGKNIKWINDNLLIADLIEIISPFIRAEIKPIIKAIKKNLMMESFGQKIQKVMESTA